LVIVSQAGVSGLTETFLLRPRHRPLDPTRPPSTNPTSLRLITTLRRGDPVDNTDPSGLLFGISKEDVRGAIEVVAGSTAVVRAAFGQVACTTATGPIGAAHCALGTTTAGTAGLGSGDGVRRVAKKNK